MRHLSFRNASFSFAYSFNAIFFMTKSDIAVSIEEIHRVLKPGGAVLRELHVGLMSQTVVPSASRSVETSGSPNMKTTSQTLYFTSFEVIRKEKRIIDRKTDGQRIAQAYLDYIAEKNRD